MNSKELRAAAERTKKFASETLELCRVHSIPIKTRENTLDANITVAEYILSTVRDDDDEPVAYEWLSSIKKPYMANRKIWWNLDGYTVSISSSWARFHCNHMPFASVQTRGQFRSLCRGLGIEMEEKDNAE